MSKHLNWMSQPFAHRGLHDPAKGVIENTTSAVQAALDQGFGLEVDLRSAACGTIMVFHDEMLQRLTFETGRVADKSREELQKISFRDTDDTMMSLQNLLDMVDGRVPLLLEIKSDWQIGEHDVIDFVKNIIKTVQGYTGPFAVMSFDPSLISACRALAPTIPRGLISEQFKDLEHWRQLSYRNRVSLRFLLSFPRTRPDFIAYDINALPAIAPMMARFLFKKPLLTWTVRSNAQQQRAQTYCDAMIFEGFVPPPQKSATAPSGASS